MESLYLYEPVVAAIVPQEDVNWYVGFEEGVGSSLSGIAVSWLFYWVFIHFQYYIFGYLIRLYVRVFWPNHGSNHVPKEIERQHIVSSEIAFPLYVMVPVIADFARKQHWSALSLFTPFFV